MPEVTMCSQTRDLDDKGEMLEKRSKIHYPALDGLRALAVTMVFITHYLAAEVPILHDWGYMGVDFFFVLSGFLITGILYDTREAPNHFRNFYVRRILRIWPLYYGVWIFLLLLWPWFHWQLEPGLLLWIGHFGNWARFLIYDPSYPIHLDLLTALTPRNWLRHIFFGHFWTLCIEEQFYLMWPLIVFAVRDRSRLLKLSAAIVMIEPLLRWALFVWLPPWMIREEFIGRATFTRLDELVMGGMIALYFRGNEREWIVKHSRALSVGLAIPFLLVYLEYRHRTHQLYVNTTDGLLSTFGITAEGLLGVALVLELTRSGGPLVRCFSMKPMVLLGRISYGFYIFHDLFHEVYNAAAAKLTSAPVARAWCAGLIAYAATLAISYVSFNTYEAFFLKQKVRFPD